MVVLEMSMLVMMKGIDLREYVSNIEEDNSREEEYPYNE